MGCPDKLSEGGKVLGGGRVAYMCVHLLEKLSAFSLFLNTSMRVC